MRTFFTIFLCASLVEASMPSGKTLASEGDSEGEVVGFLMIISLMWYFFSRPTS